MVKLNLKHGKWAELKEAANEGRPSEMLKSGDRLPLTLKNGEKIDLDIGRDESGKTFFIFHYLMKDEHCINVTSTDSGGWWECDMRRYHNSDIYNLLPDEVKEVIVPTRIGQMLDGKHIEVAFDKLFALSTTQVFGRGELSKFEPEDSQIDIFKDWKNRIKTVFGEEQPKTWWLRSPGCILDDEFCDVSSDGSYSADFSGHSAGVIAAFCIEESNINQQEKMFLDFLAAQGATSKLSQECQIERIAVEEDLNQRSIPTWAEMKQAANEGRLSELVKSGDQLPLVLKNGERIDLDVGLDESCRTYFIFHYLMSDLHPMNFECTNKGGWRNCEMHRYANEDIYDLLPDEVKAVIVPTRIVQVLNGELMEANDELFCLSATQVFGKNERWSEREPEDTRIDIFRDPRARVKVQQTEVGARASSWWLRSADASYGFDYVDSNGYYGNYFASSSYGVAFSFCIEESN